MIDTPWSQDFSKTNNPMDAIRAFLSAQRRGDAIPKNVLDWLQSGFEQYVDGDKPIDKYLGLSDERGRAPPRNKERRLKRLAALMEEMWETQIVFDINVQDSAFLVSERMAAVKGVSEYSADVLVKYWYEDRVGSPKGSYPLLFRGARDPTELHEEWAIKYPDEALASLNLNR